MVHKENAGADNGAEPNSSARVTEQKSVGGVPVLISRPGVVNPNTRLIVFYHGFGPPQNPRALAEVLRLEEMDAVLAFVNLPMVADRMPAGGRDELLRLQKEDFVNGFFFRSISGGAAELQQVVKELNATYHLDADKRFYQSGMAHPFLAVENNPTHNAGDDVVLLNARSRSHHRAARTALVGLAHWFNRRDRLARAHYRGCTFAAERFPARFVLSFVVSF
jgi:hypothetical protein